MIYHTKISHLHVDNLLNLEDLNVERTKIKKLDLRLLPMVKKVAGCTEGGRKILTAPGVTRSG